MNNAVLEYGKIQKLFHWDDFTLVGVNQLSTWGRAHDEMKNSPDGKKNKKCNELTHAFTISCDQDGA